jgi:hypothetical protein
MQDGARRLEPYIREMYYRAAAEPLALGEAPRRLAVNERH